MRRTGANIALAMVLVAICALVAPVPAAAVELPPVGTPIFIQTNGPDASINLGDWYSARTNGVGGGYHYIGINVPCNWPAALDLHIDLYSPEINLFAPAPMIDEVDVSGPDATIFELYRPGTVVSPPRVPGPGDTGSLLAQRYQPITNQVERWERFYTLSAPVQCGNYLLRAETEDDSENGWRLRVGHDNDADPTNPPPPNYDNPDGLPGTGDEPALSVTQTTYQHTNLGRVECLLLYQYVRPDIGEARFHNFDLDDNERVTYYPPSAVLNTEGLPTPGSISGTLSGFSVWNGGSQTERGSGDLVLNPEPGWWRIVTCVRDYNQFNQEGITGVPIYREPPHEPDMVVAKDDGRTVVAPGETLRYLISFSNQALSTRARPGAAFNVVLADTLPPNTSYRSCGIVTAGLRGSCVQRGGQVLFILNDPVFAGASGELEVVVTVNGGASGQVRNTVALDYEDQAGNVFPTKRAEDVDTLQAGARPQLDAFKTVRLKTDRNGDGKVNSGDTLEYAIVVLNQGPVAATGVNLRDQPDQYTTLVVGSVRLEPDSGMVMRGNAPGDRVVEAILGVIDSGAQARLTFDAVVNSGIPETVTQLANQALIQGDDLPIIPSDDPGTSTPDDPTTIPYDGPGGGPTAISLLSFGARVEGGAAVVRWITGVELNTAGFQLLRASSPDRTAATPVSALLAPQGSSGAGAAYSWIDPAPVAGPVYYWLIEQEIDGDRSEFGPARLELAGPSAATSVYLPLLER